MYLRSAVSSKIVVKIYLDYSRKYRLLVAPLLSSFSFLVGSLSALFGQWTVAWSMFWFIFGAAGGDSGQIVKWWVVS